MKNLLKELVSVRGSGPAPTFSVIHIIKALELIAERPIGRKMLSEKLVIGEGATRTLVKKLKELGLISVLHQGCIFTHKGRKLWKFIHRVFPKKTILGKSGLTLAPFNVAILVRGYGAKVKHGIDQRDAALMVGAKGATTLKFRDGELIVPPDCRIVEKDFPQINQLILDSLKPDIDDAIVIGSAETLEKAEHGALAAALVLLNDFKSISM